MFVGGHFQGRMGHVVVAVCALVVEIVGLS